MTDGDSIAQLAVVILLLVLAVPALATAYDYAGTPFDQSEDLTVDYTDGSQVSANATLEGYDDPEIVTQDGTTLVEGDDYAFDESSGDVTWYNTSNTSSGDTVTAEFVAYQRTAETQLSWQIVAPLMSLFGLFALVVSVRALWQFIAEVWDL